MRRVRDEDAARFRVSQATVLNGRYVLQSLLGRGGFSEVYRAYDVTDLRAVALKIHQLQPSWSEERKRSYVRHAAREYGILKRMAHDSIVRLHDVFEIDDESFCTVLELCEGGDLDFHLKLHGSLGEREARCLTVRLRLHSAPACCARCAALTRIIGAAGGGAALSERRAAARHTLRPEASALPAAVSCALRTRADTCAWDAQGNILFDSLGRVKITDFGLSKVWEAGSAAGAGGSEGLELTSQGAGTYWYLPPECFETGVGGAAAPKISAKVDVWSAGVIFFQMLYGRRPFGHELTQEKILREETILRAARTLDFPEKPAVSAEAKAFIRRLLTYRQAERPDVLEVSSDPYLQGWLPSVPSPGGI
jgi:tousled-like kinase